jgi:phage tail P2-like protein
MSNENNKSLLPINLTELLKNIEESGCKITELEAKNKYVFNVDLAPENILPWVAWGFSVDDWNDAWEVDIKRNIIKTSLTLHRQKGTIGSLKKALSAFNFVDIKIEEWFEYGGNPYFFRVYFDIPYAGFDINILPEIAKVIQNTKNARSHLESFKPYLSSGSAVNNLASFFISKEVTQIDPVIYEEDDLIENNSSIPSIGAFFISKEITTINPLI